MSVTLHPKRDSEEHMTGAEATESGELGRNMLGLIGAYGMGAALDVQDLYPTSSASASQPEPVDVVAA